MNRTEVEAIAWRIAQGLCDELLNQIITALEERLARLEHGTGPTRPANSLADILAEGPCGATSGSPMELIRVCSLPRGHSGAHFSPSREGA